MDLFGRQRKKLVEAANKAEAGRRRMAVYSEQTTAENRQLHFRIRHLEAEINRLASFMMKNFQDEIKEGSAVDNAIRLLNERK